MLIFGNDGADTVVTTSSTSPQTILGGNVSVSTITYAVNGKQYIAVLTGEGLLSGGLITQANLKPTRGYNALYVFALP